MNKRIIYKNTDGTVAVIVPADNVPYPPTKDQINALSTRMAEALAMLPAGFDGSVDTPPDDVAVLLEDIAQELQALKSRTFTIEEIAAKDVPTGLAYKIVDVADIPADRADRAFWDVDEADLTDGVGA